MPQLACAITRAIPLPIFSADSIARRAVVSAAWASPVRSNSRERNVSTQLSTSPSSKRRASSPQRSRAARASSKRPRSISIQPRWQKVLDVEKPTMSMPIAGSISLNATCSSFIRSAASSSPS